MRWKRLGSGQRVPYVVRYRQRWCAEMAGVLPDRSGARVMHVCQKWWRATSFDKVGATQRQCHLVTASLLSSTHHLPLARSRQAHHRNSAESNYASDHRCRAVSMLLLLLSRSLSRWRGTARAPCGNAFEALNQTHSCHSRQSPLDLAAELASGAASGAMQHGDHR